MAFKFNRNALKSLILVDIKDFSRQSGCSRQQVDAYLNRGIFPSVRTLEEISKGFHLKSEFFFTEIE